MTSAQFLDYATTAAILLILIALGLSFIRLALGPTFSDRVIALDLMTVLLVAFSGLFAVRTGVSAFIDVAVVLALIGFLATVALARFAERGLHRRNDVPSPPEIARLPSVAYTPAPEDVAEARRSERQQ